MQSILHIIKVNDQRNGVGKESGKPYSLQDCECILLKDDGTPDQVGVLLLPKDLTGKTIPGQYLGSFALRPNLQTRKIEAVLTGLQPVPPDYFKRAKPAPVAGA